MINAGREFRKRLYFSLKPDLEAMLSEDIPITAKEMFDRLRNDGVDCNINQVVAAMSALRDEGKARSFGYRGKAQLWYRTSKATKDKIRRSDGDVKVSWMQDQKGS